MVGKWLSLLLIFAVLLCAGAVSAADLAYTPQFDLIIRPASFSRPTFAVKGTVTIPGYVDHVNVAGIPWQKFVFKVADVEQQLDEEGLIMRPAGLPVSAAWQVAFEGLSELRPPKSMATGDEIYCLNNFPPNPELITDNPSRYNVRFDLPAGYSAISFDGKLTSAMGLQFQIARSPDFRSLCCERPVILLLNMFFQRVILQMRLT